MSNVKLASAIHNAFYPQRRFRLFVRKTRSLGPTEGGQMALIVRRLL